MSAVAKLNPFTQIRRVLGQVLFLNLAVSGSKLVVGFMTGSISMAADGFHSLLDASSNVIGLLGITLAARPADRDHPYGHRKYETFAAMSIAGLLVLTAWEILEKSLEKLRTGGHPAVPWFSFAVMIGTIFINLWVASYERRRGKALNSEVLIADAMHTTSDIFVSLSVIASLIAARLGFPLLDVFVAFGITGVIFLSSYRIIKKSSIALLDTAVIDPTTIEKLVMNVPNVCSCHEVRTRGPAHELYIDLHIQVAPELTIERAHQIAHQVKAQLKAQLRAKDVIVHVEPAKRPVKDHLLS